jgi:hypothetical protein
MDVASPLIEYVNSGRMMSMDEISGIIKVVRSADKYKADSDRLAEALKWYADKNHYSDDDWGVLSVISPPEYGNPGQIARAALAAHEEWKNG